MRARMALACANVPFTVREVVLSNKPAQMMEASPKGTVPVLLLGHKVIEESLDILLWALAQNDPEGWLDFPQSSRDQMAALVGENDQDFKHHLDHYKYADRFPDQPQQHYREQGEKYLAKLEELLSQTTASEAYLFGEKRAYADIAILPFVRQFANVDATWFADAPYPNLAAWLDRHLSSELFRSVMKKYPPWADGDPVTTFTSEQTT
jgi:glutathione S-transferase